MADPIPKITVGDYRVVLGLAREALKAVEKCLEGRPPDDLITEEDWACVKTTYDQTMQGRGKPPMTGDPC